MRKALVTLVLVTIALFNLAMGDLGTAPREGIPTPENESHAVIVDRAENRVELERFTMDGKTAIEGTLGKGQVTIPFRNIRSIDFLQGKKNELPARLTLSDGREITLSVRQTETFFGDTGFGTYTIRARDLQKIQFP